MNEELYHPVPDIGAYLDRIGIAKVRDASPGFLDELIYAHQRSVPFDNLDVYELGLTPSLGIGDLFDKIVVRKRGGYCFELNALFAALLRGLGFDVRPCMARVIMRPNPYPLISHRANLVTFGDGARLADVGFGGPMPTFAPLLADGRARCERGQSFTLHRCDELWWEVGYLRSDGREWRVLRVCTMPVDEHDFVPLSFYQANSPESVFRLNRMANMKTEDGAIDLRNSTFTEYRGAGKTIVELETEQEVRELLAERFGIVL